MKLTNESLATSTLAIEVLRPIMGGRNKANFLRSVIFRFL